MIKSNVRIIGVGHDPIKVKGLLKPLTLQWDGVGGQFQLMVLTALTDVDIVLGMDVLRQLDVKINFKNQDASPAREPCTRLKSVKTVGLLLDNPTFTCKGKIPVKEEEVEEVVKGVLRQGHREVHRVWMASDRKIKTEDKRKDRMIVRESLMPWNQAGYKAQLKKDLKDIQQKLSRVLGQDLGQSNNSFVEAKGPVKCIEGSVLVDLCMQRSGKRGSGCDTPKSFDGFPKAPEGFPNTVASPPRTPTPPAAQVRQYSWRKYVKMEVCLYIRTLKPLKTKKEEGKLEFKRPGATSYQNHSDVIVTSLLPSCQKSEGESQQYSVIRDNAGRSNSEMNQLVHVSQYTNNRHILKPSKTRKEKGEVKFKRPGSTNCQRPSDVIVSDVISGT